MRLHSLTDENNLLINSAWKAAVEELWLRGAALCSAGQSSIRWLRTSRRTLSLSLL